MAEHQPIFSEWQQPTFAPPRSHRDDPESSKAAAKQHAESGNCHRNADLVLAILRRIPGSTAVELWELCEQPERDALKEMQEVRRRLSDMADVKIGRVKVTGQRKCRFRGTLQSTYEAT